MQADIGVGMARKAHVVWEPDAADPEMIPRRKGVNVIPLADPDIIPPGGEQALGGSEILPGRYLQIVFAALDDQRDQARRLGDGGVVGQLTANRSAMCGEDRLETEALRR